MSFIGNYILKKATLNWKPVTPLIIGVRNVYYRYYPNWYLEPISSREELDRLENEGKLEAMKVLPVKPARPDMTDSVFDDPILKHFTNVAMMWSEKTLARQLMHGVFARIKRIQLAKYHAAPEEERASIVLNPLSILKEAIRNCQPVLALTPVKKGGITYQVPVPITPNKSLFMSMKWLIMAARDKDGPISFVDQLTKELLDAYNLEGRVLKRKQDLHKICENNKAYAHYRWS